MLWVREGRVGKVRVGGLCVMSLLKEMDVFVYREARNGCVV